MAAPFFTQVKRFFLCQVLAVSGAFLFFLSFPNPQFRQGISWFAFFAAIPVFIIVKRASWKGSFFAGGVYGALCIALFNHYTINYGIHLFLFLITLWFLYNSLLFMGLKAFTLLSPPRCYIFQTFLWVVFEYLKTIGFLGYPYGIFAYSQHSFPELIQVSSITGIWGVSFLLLFPAAFLGNALSMSKAHIVSFIKSNFIPVMLYIILFISSIIYGSSIIRDSWNPGQKGDSSNPNSLPSSVKIASVQQNDLSFLGDSTSLENKLKRLITLSNSALPACPILIVWSEGAFDSAINWYYRYKEERHKRCIEELKAYLSNQSVHFLIGNIERVVTQNVFNERTIGEYNSSYLFLRDTVVSVYRKKHLVPFGESFPFEREFPRLYQWVRQHPYTRLFIKGEPYGLMEIAGVRFSPVICFEDSFSDISREIVKKGAHMIINQTSDSHAYSPVASLHHMNMAIFRCVENRRSMLRSTNYGLTCVISPYGKILAQLPFSVEEVLVADVPLAGNNITFYTQYGDWMIFLFVLILSGVLIFFGIYSIRAVFHDAGSARRNVLRTQSYFATQNDVIS